MNSPVYAFTKEAGQIINSGQSRSLVLTGNITDLFFTGGEQGDYVPLMNYLTEQWSVKGTLLVSYELNGPIRFLNEKDEQKVRDGWERLHEDTDNQHAIDLALARTRKRLEALRAQPRSSFDSCMKRAEGNPTYALEFLRQLCIVSRTQVEGQSLLWEDLVILIEGGDFLLPEGEIARLGDVDRQRVSVGVDWFSDPGFINGGDTVILLAESLSLLNPRISRLPQVLQVEVESPDEAARLHMIHWYMQRVSTGREIRLWDTPEALSRMTAGLSSHALLQLLRLAEYSGSTLTPEDVIGKVEHYIQGQLGVDVVEFKRPGHGLEDVVGFTRMKAFMKRDFIPRIQSRGKGALPGAAVGGAIGSGKSFLLEAIAGELGMVVLVLKNIRSKWFGGTDVLFERLKRIVYALDKTMVFIDEADTQFGGVGEDAHATERRLTGKIQAMMSDPALRGKTTWLLITARIHLLSPDIRRPGRAGSLILPILDPVGEDREAFIRWVLSPVLADEESPETLDQAVTELSPYLNGYYAAAFAELRSDLLAKAEMNGTETLSLDMIRDTIMDYIPPSVESTRRYQELQALINCTRLQLLPEGVTRDNLEEQKDSWHKELRALEVEGVR